VSPEEGSAPATRRFLALADEDGRRRFAQLEGEASGWAEMQQAFLKMVDAYLEFERGKPVEENINAHEAGGQWRIAFPHLAVRGDRRVAQRLGETMAARKAWTDANFHHGYHKCHEVHHEIETFIFFQIPLLNWGLPGADLALQSIEDLAHHVGSWEPDVPAWYDWKRSEFVSTWLGTREVRDFPPHDYQEANHFRFTDVVMAAYLGTGEQRCLDLVRDYADRWCDHIEALAAKGEPVRCSILPREATSQEMGYGGARRDGTDQYKVFYTTVALNTAFDISAALLDLYRVTGNDRYLDASRHMVDQFFKNGSDGRPALAFSDGEWTVLPQPDDLEALGTYLGVPVNGGLLANMALRYDRVTGQDQYRNLMLDWAARIDEEANPIDQMIPGVLVAAHFYDGNPDWLTRAYAMALRLAAVVEQNDVYHQCNCHNRQGSKASMGSLYQPALGGIEWGWFGNIPLLRLKHRTAKRNGLPENVAFRTWRIDATTDGFEARNLTDQPVEWEIESDAREQELLGVRPTPDGDTREARLQLGPRESRTGRLVWSECRPSPHIKPMKRN